MKDDEKQINFSLVDLFFLGGGYKIFDSTHLIMVERKTQKSRTFLLNN